ncbi:LysR family transcriptional regulator, partial [Pseudoalteromonas sp. S4389]
MKLPPLRALQCFEAVAQLNSFSKAAEHLNVTQSAVSHQVRLLEDYLG